MQCYVSVWLDIGRLGAYLTQSWTRSVCEAHLCELSTPGGSCGSMKGAWSTCELMGASLATSLLNTAGNRSFPGPRCWPEHWHSSESISPRWIAEAVNNKNGQDEKAARQLAVHRPASDRDWSCSRMLCLDILVSGTLRRSVQHISQSEPHGSIGES